jgi:hypothetical protein
VQGIKTKYKKTIIMAEVQFIFNTELVAGLENLIKNSKHKLLLVSPFIDLSKEIRAALNEHIAKHDFELYVLFGKNEDNLYKSIKKDSFEFLKQFPNVEIRYNERLHAKFYQNDFDFIMTSINLYDYSLAKNIEVGIICNYASKGLIGKVMDGTDTIVSQSIDKVKQDVLGFGNKEINPIEQFQKIFETSELKYKTEPIKVEKNGITGIFGAKKLNGFNVIVDNLTIISKDIKEQKVEKAETVVNTSSKPISASQLSKSLGVTQSDITSIMENAGLINGDKITALGQSKGLVVKNYMGKDYIAYPENLAELSVFVK